MRKPKGRKQRILTILCAGFAILLCSKQSFSQSIEELNYLVDQSWFALKDGQLYQDKGSRYHNRDDLERALDAYRKAVQLTQRTLDMEKYLGLYRHTPSRVFYQVGHAHLGISEIYRQFGANSQDLWMELDKSRRAFGTTLHILYQNEYPGDPNWRRRASLAHFYLGITFMNLGDLAMARRELVRSRKMGYNRAAEALEWMEPRQGQRKISERPPQNLSGSRLWEYVKAISGIFLPKWGRLATMVLEDLSNIQ